MKQRVSRRSFLKGTGLSTLALALSSRRVSSFTGRAKEVSTARLTSIPTVCAMCRARCHLLAKVKDGRLVKIEGNPLSPANGATICARGQAAVKLLYDPDRLKYPLRRVGARGEGRWLRISWQEALDEIAANFKKHLLQNGADSLALLAGGPSASFIKKLFHDHGVTNIHDAAIHHCDRIRNIAHQATFGVRCHDPNHLDYTHSRCLVLLGSHLGENVQVQALKGVTRALDQGAKLVVVDPRFSAIANKADLYLPIKPGTDIALILGWLNHIVSEGLYDSAWVEANTSGLAELKNHLAGYPLYRVSSITGLPVRSIRESAEMMAAAAPATLVHPGGQQSWYGNDVQRVRALAILSAVLGAVNVPGGLTLAGGGADDLYPELSESDRSMGPSFSALTDGLLAGKIKMAGCWGQNPLQNHAAPYKTIMALEKAEFVFCCDVLPGEAALYADIVIPEATFLERHDILEFGWSGEQSLVASRFPVVSPRFEAREPYGIAKELNERIGVKAGFDHADGEAFLDSRLAPLGLTLSDLAARGGVQRLAVKKDDSPVLRHYPEEPYVGAQTTISYPTASGRIELVSRRFAEMGWEPLPGFLEPEEPPPGYVRLLYGRSPVHSMSSTINNGWLIREYGENEIWVNEEYGRGLGLRHGERIFLENQDGIRSLKPIRVKLTPGIRKDCVYMVHGFGSRSPHLSLGFQRGVSDTSLMTLSRVDPFSGQRGMRVNYVRFVRMVKKGGNPA